MSTCLLSNLAPYEHMNIVVMVVVNGNRILLILYKGG